MNKVVDTLYSKLPPQVGQVGASTTIDAGMVIAEDLAAAVVVPVTDAVGTTLTVCGIATQSVATAGGETDTVNYIPVNRAVFVVVDCTNNTALDQLHQNHAMTDANTVLNTSSNVATTLGIFHALGVVGTATTKKLYGYYNAIGQVTA